MQAIQPGKYDPSTLNEGARMQPRIAVKGVSKVTRHNQRLAAGTFRVCLMALSCAQLIAADRLSGTQGWPVASRGWCER